MFFLCGSLFCVMVLGALSSLAIIWPRKIETELVYFTIMVLRLYHSQIQREDRGCGPLLENHKAKGFLSNTGADPLE